MIKYGSKHVMDLYFVYCLYMYQIYNITNDFKLL